MTPEAGPLPARTPWSAVVLTAVAVLLPLMAYLGPLGFGPLLALAGLCLLPSWSRRPLRRLDLLPFAALVVWALASYAWSPVAPALGADLGYDDVEDLVGLKLLFQLPVYATVVLTAASLSGMAAHRFMLITSACLAGVGIVLTLDALAGLRLYQWLAATFDKPMAPERVKGEVGQGTVVIAVLLWPCFLLLRGTIFRALTLGLFAAPLLAALMLQQQSAVIAVGAGGLAFWLVLTFGAVASRILGAASATVLMAAPWLMLAAARAGAPASLAPMLPASWDARLEIWSFASARVLERPLLGWGLDASRTFPSPISLHPHSMALQLWLELGMVGAVLGAVLWWIIFHLAARLAAEDRAAGGAAAGAAAAYFLIGNLSFGVWQEWWLALGAFAMAVCAALAVARRCDRMAESPAVRLRTGELQPL